jgi:hypothetical protein
MASAIPFTDREQEIVDKLSGIIQGITKPNRGLLSKIRNALAKYKTRRAAEATVYANHKQRKAEARERALMDFRKAQGYPNKSYMANAKTLQELNNPFASSTSQITLLNHDPVLGHLT